MSAIHGHAHAPASWSAALGIGLNLAFVAVEAFYGWRIGSLALLADAGHNLSDVIGLVLAWGGALAGRLQPDVHHTGTAWSGPGRWAPARSRSPPTW